MPTTYLFAVPVSPASRGLDPARYRLTLVADRTDEAPLNRKDRDAFKAALAPERDSGWSPGDAQGSSAESVSAQAILDALTVPGGGVESAIGEAMTALVRRAAAMEIARRGPEGGKRAQASSRGTRGKNAKAGLTKKKGKRGSQDECVIS